jgi:hypothetical protein
MQKGYFRRFAVCFNLANFSLIITMPRALDKYDYVILDIVFAFKRNNSILIKLSQLELAFWSRIEHDDAKDMQSAQLGERIATLYLQGYLNNKGGSGYCITKKGKEEIALQTH